VRKLRKSRRKANQNSGNSNWVVVDCPPEPEPFTPDWFALNFLAEWTPEDLTAAIERGVHPEDLTAAIERGVQVDFSMFAGYIEDMAIKKILEWFKTYRPDLYGVLSAPEGVEWLRRQIKRILRSG